MPIPAQKDMIDRVIRLQERVRRLEVRKNPAGGGDTGTYYDLIPHLQTYNNDPAVQSGWEPFDYGDGPRFGAHVVGGRCFLVGGAFFWDWIGPGWAQTILNTALPAECRPSDWNVNITGTTDWENNYSNNGTGQWLNGAVWQADVTQGGFIFFESMRLGGGSGVGFYDHGETGEDATWTDGVNQRLWHRWNASDSWRAPHAFGIPHGAAVQFEGCSWLVRAAE